MEIYAFLSGFLLGIFTNFIWWVVSAKLIVPKVVFSRYISKQPIENSLNKSGFKYRIKIVNSTRRPIYDLEIRVILKIKGLGTTDGNTSNYSIALDYEGKDISKSLIFESNKIIQLYINRTQNILTSDFIPTEIKEKYNVSALKLEDLLKLGKEAYLIIHASGYDGFSGARKFYNSKKYFVHDIYGAKYFPRNNLNINYDFSSKNANENNLYYDYLNQKR